MLALHGVTVRFGAVRALRGIELVVPTGGTTVLLGGSGSGKSTLLRVALGLVRPEQGSVRFAGAAVDAASAPGLRLRMGYLIQDGGLFPHLDARANVTLMARHLGWDAARTEARVAELAALTHFPADALRRHPAQLSGGQCQRVALMRALLLDPELLLLDEPLAALDPLIRAELQQELREIFRALGKSVLLVTHDLAEAAFFADRIALLREGALVQEGTLGDLLERPADPFVTRFVGAQRGAFGGPA